MPNDKTEFDLEKLKTDSQMWMRLAMSVEGSDRLENVFPGTKNPFEEYGEASIEKVRKLADEGKLYVREFGRSRHFRQVEKDGDKLNLGDTKEIRVNTTYSDPALAVLMYLSRAFFKGSAIDRFVDWIGLGSISGWFDKRLEHRRELIDKEERYKQEYNSMTDDQKEKLKELRANEKEVAKIQKELQKQAKLEAEARENLKNLEEQTNSIRRKLNQLQGKEDTGNSNEMTAPLTQPAPPQDQPTMQPILEGDPNQLDKKQEQPPQDTKKTEQEEKKKGITLVSGDKVYTAENLNELPEEVRKMLEMIQKVIEQMETQKKQEQLQQNPQSTDLQNEQEQQQQQPPQTELNAVNNEEQQIVNENAENPPLNPQGENEQEQQQQQQQLQTELNAVNNEEPAIVNQTEENPRTNLQDENEQLQEQAEAVPEDWRDMIANALFSHGQGGDLMEQYQQVKDDRENSAIFLAGAIYGVLKASTLDPEGNQKMLEDIFNGRSLGDEKNDLIRAGLDTAQNAMQKSNEQNDNTQMEEMLTTAVKHLKEFAGDGNAVTPQRAMAIMMVSLAEGLALDLGLQLPQEEVAPKENLPNPEEQEELQEVDLQPLFHDVEEEPQAETNVPLNQPAEIEPGQVNIQPEPEQPEQEEIPENEQAVPEDWRDVLVKALFSHENGVDLLAQYQQVKDNPLDSAVFLASAIFGVLKENIIDREPNQNLLEQIFNGRSLGNGNDDLVRSGMESAQDAMRKCEAQEDLQPLEKMLTIAVRELKEYAGDGNEPTPQQAMAAMMAELAEGFARDFGVQLPQEEVLQQNEQPQAETDVPLNQPTEIEPEQVNIQPEPEQPEQIREEKQERRSRKAGGMCCSALCSPIKRAAICWRSTRKSRMTP